LRNHDSPGGKQYPLLVFVTPLPESNPRPSWSIVVCEPKE
jgi:hypothetical protein